MILVWVSIRSQSSRSVAKSRVRERAALLLRLRQIWIEEVLNASLYQEARIRLSLKVSLDEPHPWGVRVSTNRGEVLRAGQEAITDLFSRQLAEQIIVLGGPGAGKTTMLLELLQGLIKRAEDSADERFPILLNLSAWLPKFSKLEQWIAHEASVRYQVSSDFISDSLASGEAILLLDGLDELAQHNREKCIEAINTFRIRHGEAGIAICCRSKDYEQLETKLRTYGSVEIQPLTMAQVESYLRRHGRQHALETLQQDLELKRLVRTPLLLSILMLAYQDRSTADVEAPNALARLVTRYVQVMLEQRGRTPDQRSRLVTQLSYIARATTASKQTVFDFDSFDTDWVYPYHSTIRARVACALIASPVALLAWMWAYDGILAAIAVIIACICMAIPNENQIDSGWLTFSAGRRIIGDHATVEPNPLKELGLSLAAIAIEQPASIIVGLPLGTMAGFLFGWSTTSGIAFGVASFASVWITCGICLMTWHVAEPDRVPARKREIPGPQAVAVRFRGLIFVHVGATLTFLVAYIIVYLGIQWSGYGTYANEKATTFAVVVSLLSAWYIFVAFGELASVEQSIIRSILAKKRVLFKPLRPWLDHACECLLLRKVGESYAFPHLVLRDFFASIWSDTGVPQERIEELLQLSNTTSVATNSFQSKA
ncbi:NACHT domain-containing protein [Phytomonospora endophytica]|nr:NACHT domain-containing protein [Phytomonospora endophytica]